MKVTPQPLHSGRISPMLYGGFIELLDDLVPGMWAEMLNDRGFEGVQPPSHWCYYNGAPNVCDRPWDRSRTWTLDARNPFNGQQSAKLVARQGAAASLTQAGLAVREGMAYRFEGYFRGEDRTVKPRVTLKAQHPDGSWIKLGSADLARPTAEWSKQGAQIVSSGTTDRAVFELSVAGTGTLWADKLSLMPADNVKGWRKDVVRVIKESHPALIRWGGSVVDPGGYRWKIGIGERDLRVPFVNKPWGRIDPNDVGIDEFLQFCGLVDAEPLICVSFSDGPQSAKDLVEYCNGATDTAWGRKRAENGHRKAYGVRYWQVGNELGDAAYVSGCAAVCRAIKEADPAAIVLSSYPSAALLAETGKYLDYVCPHHYVPDLTADEKSIDDTVRMMKEAAPGRELKIGVTEWNVTGGWWGNGRGKLLTLESALFAARYLNLLHRRSDVVGLACRSNMTNSCGSGMIQTSPGGMYMTPSYYVMKLYADHSRPVPVTVADVPESVDASACASEDGNRLTVFLVNTKPEPVEVPLDLSGFGAGFGPRSAEVVRDTLDFRQLELMNHVTAPDRVRTVKLPLEGAKITLPGYAAAAVECGAG